MKARCLPGGRSGGQSRRAASEAAWETAEPRLPRCSHPPAGGPRVQNLGLPTGSTPLLTDLWTLELLCMTSRPPWEPELRGFHLGVNKPFDSPHEGCQEEIFQSDIQARDGLLLYNSSGCLENGAVVRDFQVSARNYT